MDLIWKYNKQTLWDLASIACATGAVTSAALSYLQYMQISSLRSATVLNVRVSHSLSLIQVDYDML